jgi:hypothetical protein
LFVSLHLSLIYLFFWLWKEKVASSEMFGDRSFWVWRPSYHWRCEESKLPWYLIVARHESTDDMVCGWLFVWFILISGWRVLGSSVTLRPLQLYFFVES